MKKILSSETGAMSPIIGEEKAIEYIAKAGFDAYDLSLSPMCWWNWSEDCPYESTHPFSGSNYLSYVRQLKKIADDNGIFCNQSHAPFPSDKPVMFDKILRSIECTAEVGGKICVIHPAVTGTAQDNAEFFGKLLPFAKQHNVKLATENMFWWHSDLGRAGFAMCGSPESFNEVLDAVNDDYFVACLDIGHAELGGLNTSAVEMIRALGSRLKALHIHDNNKVRDQHQLPFTGNVDFYAVAKALKEINYMGDFTSEATAHFNGCTKENVFDRVKSLYESFKRFREIYEDV